MKQLIIVIMLVLITGCSGSVKSKLSPDEMRKEKAIDQVIYKTARELRKKHQLCCSVKGAAAMYKIEMLEMGFDYLQTMDVNKARELFVIAHQLFLKKYQ